MLWYCIFLTLVIYPLVNVTCFFLFVFFLRSLAMIHCIILVSNCFRILYHSLPVHVSSCFNIIQRINNHIEWLKESVREDSIFCLWAHCKYKAKHLLHTDVATFSQKLPCRYSWTVFCFIYMCENKIYKPVRLSVWIRACFTGIVC